MALRIHGLCNYKRCFRLKENFKLRFDFFLKLDDPSKEPPSKQDEKYDYSKLPRR